jgi:peptidoglycan/xylan/chitin deacetylase (PgdA/CDA1 family)
VINVYYKIQRAISNILITKKRALNLPEAVITFTFDDIPNSAFTNGRRILNQYGYKGTYYVALGLTDKNREGGSYFDPACLKQIVDDGGELGCHTYNHIHLYTSGKKQIIDDLDANQKKINEYVPGYKFKNFSYPYGEQNFISKLITRKRYKSARSVKHGINTNITDLNNLKAVGLEEVLKLEEVYNEIEQAIKLKGWLILFAHDIEPSHSLWGCTPEYFERVVKYCSDRKVKVLTVEKVLENIS